MPREGLTSDLALADPTVATELAATQTAGLGETSLFDDEAIADECAGRTERFARRIQVTLAPGCTPRNATGSPAPGVRPGEVVTVGPADGRASLERALHRSQASISEMLWSPLTVPMVLVVRTWEGFDVDQVRRGCGWTS